MHSFKNFSERCPGFYTICIQKFNSMTVIMIASIAVELMIPDLYDIIL